MFGNSEMASIRRTLSPVARAGATQNGEAHLVPSPLSKSSYVQTHSSLQSGGGLLSTVLGLVGSNQLLYRVQNVVLDIFSQRPSRPTERSKSKVSPWRRAIFHFVICFMIGIFVGFTPFLSMTSLHLDPNHKAFSFDDIPPARNARNYDVSSSNKSSSNQYFTSNKSLSQRYHLMGVHPDDNPVPRVPVQDLVFASRKLLIIVTPTYSRPFQAYYLHRLSHTLMLVPPPILWIVVEMSAQSDETADILRRTGVMYRHLVCGKNLTSVRDRRPHQRNVALAHIEKHRLNGIVYFADDDNMYSVDLFEHMQRVRRFGTWPVAILTESKNKAILEGPVCNANQVSGWHTSVGTRKMRRFHTDMSGLAFNSTILWDPKRWHRPTLEPVRQLDTLKEGFQDSNFVEQFIEDESQMEGLQNCSTIFVWHLHVEASHPFYPQNWLLKKNLDIVELLV